MCVRVRACVRACVCVLVCTSSNYIVAHIEPSVTIQSDILAPESGIHRILHVYNGIAVYFLSKLILIEEDEPGSHVEALSEVRLKVPPIIKLYEYLPVYYMQTQRLREEQDAAYHQSLETDRQRVCVKMMIILMMITLLWIFLSV